jgi:hypothetical protein
MSTETAPNPPVRTDEPEWVTLVRAKVQGLDYGVVQLVVHGGRVTQIERTEKTRLAFERRAGSQE